MSDMEGIFQLENGEHTPDKIGATYSPIGRKDFNGSLESKNDLSSQKEAKLNLAIFEKLNVRNISDILLEHEN